MDKHLKDPQSYMTGVPVSYQEMSLDHNPQPICVIKVVLCSLLSVGINVELWPNNY